METDNKTAQPELTLEESFNLLVNLARQSKLSYQEHSVVDKAVKTVLEALNKASEKKDEASA